MKIMLGSSPANRISVKNQILTVGLIAAVALVVHQTMLVSEADAAKELETTCAIQENYDPDNVDIEQRLCCTYEVDTETGERETLECWVEYCHVPT